MRLTTVLRLLDRALEPTKYAVLNRYADRFIELG